MGQELEQLQKNINQQTFLAEVHYLHEALLDRVAAGLLYRPYSTHKVHVCSKQTAAAGLFIIRGGAGIPHLPNYILKVTARSPWACPPLWKVLKVSHFEPNHIAEALPVLHPPSPRGRKRGAVEVVTLSASRRQSSFRKRTMIQ